MVKDNNFIKESSSIIEEIETQLQDVLSKKKQLVEQELQEKIKAEQEEAQKKISEIESELKGNQEALVNYKNVLSQFESDKEQLKGEIKQHLETAIQLQTEIEEKTGQSLNELRAVSELTKKLDEINSEAAGKVNALKSELEEKYGIIAHVPESNGRDEVDFDLENELSKLQKIKELLGDTGVGERAREEPKKEAESAAEEEAVKEATSEEATEGGEAGEEQETQPADEEQPESDEVSTAEGEVPEEEEESAGGEAVLDVEKALDESRKSEPIEDDGELVYFEKNDKQVLDAQNLLSTLATSLEGARKLYNKLTEAESPKDQFFIKQEIIRHQDLLRKIMLSNIRMSEKENCSLPKHTEDVLNSEALKVILEKVSMENWSNKEDFHSFENYFTKLSDDFNKKLTPPEKYLDSILKELEIK